MNDVKAARLLSCWRSDNRKTVSVTKREYDELLYKVPRLFVAVEQGTAVVSFVILDRQVATNFLKAEYNLHDVTDHDTIRGNPIGEQRLLSQPNIVRADNCNPIQTPN